MASAFTMTTLGRTGLKVGRLGLAGSYGAPAGAYEAAFDRGCNYFYSGSGRKRSQMKAAVRTLVNRGYRDRMVISIQTYARMGLMTKYLFKQALTSMGIDHADILMLGWHNSKPSNRLIDFALSMKEKGLARFIGLSGHNRRLFADLARSPETDAVFDLFQIRYNPAHTGAEKDCFPDLDQRGRQGIVSYTATRWGHLLKEKYMPPGEPPLTASDCYRFALSNPLVDVCLTGPRNKEEVAHALSVLDKGPLTLEETERIRRIGAHVHDTAGGVFS
ncbi:MAG TPA: hypothetical protein DHV36_12695 [Desulfobacteraceae bacterium]|nr:hypothetical protein [Desulfobacteraceae bacterium]